MKFVLIRHVEEVDVPRRCANEAFTPKHRRGLPRCGLLVGDLLLTTGAT